MDNKTPQWEIEFEEQFDYFEGGWSVGDKEVTPRKIKAFIKSTLEELIDDIDNVDIKEFITYKDGIYKEPETSTVDGVIYKLKQQLKNKWL